MKPSPLPRLSDARSALLALVACGLLLGCEAAPESEADFGADLAAFREARLADLSAPDGWLSLVGLFWLEEGPQSFGTDTGNALVFPADRAPAHLGTFTLTDSTVVMTVAPEAEVRHADVPVERLVMTADTAVVATHGSLHWYVIRRGERFAIRLKDTEAPTRTGFTGLDVFAPDVGWRVAGRFVPYDPPRTIPVPDIFGNLNETPALGTLVFEKDGQTYRPVVIRDGDEPRFFLLFADETNGPETYGGGRYLKVDEPTPGDDRIVIDFNQAYNPPCVFTPYATCPLPPPQNRLPIRVEAGEKKYTKPSG